MDARQWKKIAKKTGLGLVYSLLCLLVLLAFLCLFAAAWYLRVYGNTGFDSVIYTLTGGLGGTGGGLIMDFLLAAALPAVLAALALCLLLFFVIF